VRSLIRFESQSNQTIPLGTIYLAFRILNIAAALLCWLLQLIVDSDIDNIICATFSGLSIIVTSIYCFRASVIRNHLISAFSIYGVALVALGLALFGLTLEWRPLTFNLQVPVLTFASSFAFVLLCILSHALFAHIGLFTLFGDNIRKAIYRPLGLLRMPSDLELWLLGLIGVGSVLASGTAAQIYGASGHEAGDAGGKLVQALGAFVAAPFIIGFKGSLIANNDKGPGKLTWVLLGLYFFVMLGLAIVRNQRNSFAEIVLIVIV
jgi:hypothetical protein